MMEKIKEKFNLTRYLFEENRISNDQIAIVWKNTEITRKDLYNNVIKTADYLTKIGITENSKIVLALNDTPSVFEFFLGAIAIGAIPILINPKTTLADLNYILKDSGAEAFVSEIRELSELEIIYKENPFIISRNRIIIQDKYVSDLEIIKNNKEYFYPRSSKSFFIEDEDLEMQFIYKLADEPAFWQYTSGTTGKPKAVIHSQVSMISNTVNFAEKTLKISQEDTIFSVSKMFFGYGLGNSLFFPIWTGAKVIIEDTWPSPKNLIEIIEKNKPTVFFAVPKVYGLLCNQILDNIDLSGVRIFYSAGSNLNAILNQKWHFKTSKYITQGIGCTEIGHVYISTKPSRENIQVTGKPVPGFLVKIDNSVDLQNSGELLVKPSYPLLGYKDKNIQGKFLNDNWYRTGDKFVTDSEGNYKFISRVDDLFKVNGRVVVPSTIENYVIENYPVNEALLIGVENENKSDTDSHLFITVKEKIIRDEAMILEIKDSLKSNMPSFMCPKTISIIDKFEYNSNGKIIKSSIVKRLQNLSLV